VTGTVYLLHFSRPYKHARHYIGWADNLAARLALHETGQGARLLAVARAAGITWQLARTWPGDRFRERQIKTQGGASRHCPMCGVTPRAAPAQGTLQGIVPAAPPVPVRDRYGRYLLPDPDTGQERAWTRATTLARALADTAGLARWSDRMLAAGLAARPDLAALAASPDADAKVIDRVCDAARHTAGADAGAIRGTALHKAAEHADLGTADRLRDAHAADLASYSATLTAAGIILDPAHVERVTAVPQLAAAGTLDRLAAVPGAGLVIADLKTGQDLSRSWGEIAIQLAIYSRGCGLWNGQGYDPMPAVSQQRALVIHLPAGQAHCDLHWIDIDAGWEAARLAAAARAWRTRRDLAAPFAAEPIGAAA
jgi:predicted GIY-YIG superfamily endonuclease